MFISYKFHAMHIHTIHWHWQEPNWIGMWEVKRVAVIILEARSLAFLITVNIDQRPLLGARPCINHLTIMDIPPDYNDSATKTPLKFPVSVLFFLLSLKRFLSVPSFWGRDWWLLRKSDLSSLRSFSVSFVLLLWQFFLLPHLHPYSAPSPELPHSHFIWVCMLCIKFHIPLVRFNITQMWSFRLLV